MADALPAPYKLQLIRADHVGVERLLQLSDELMLKLYPPEICFLDDAATLNQNNVRLLGLFHHGELVGMGAVKFLNEDIPYGEIKRVFIEATHRGKGLAKYIMQQLEGWAREVGVGHLRLETGPKQPEAVSLYDKLGFQTRGPFGPYEANDDSIFMEKQLLP